jgi:hypothetical protein
LFEGAAILREPVLNAILMADSIITEDNGKKVLIGLFNRFTFSTFPVQTPLWFIFTAFENVEGSCDFTLNLARSETMEVVCSVSGRVEIKDPAAGVELAIPLASVTFARPGAYVLSFILDGHVLGTRVLQVVHSGSEA